LNKAREQARRIVCANDIKQVGIAITAYTSDSDKMPWYGERYQNPPPVSGRDTGTIHPFVVYRADQYYGSDTTALRPMRLACLYALNYISDPKLFYCPSNKNSNYMYKSYTSPGKWGTLPQTYNVTTDNQWVRIGLAYYPIDDSLAGAAFTEADGYTGTINVPIYTAKTFTRLSKNSPYLTDVIWSRGDIAHKSGLETTATKKLVKNGGINALFKDGHVRFVKDEKVSYKLTLVSPVTQGTIFDNGYWDLWDPVGSKPTGDDDCRLIFYGIFKLIKP